MLEDQKNRPAMLNKLNNPTNPRRPRRLSDRETSPDLHRRSYSDADPAVTLRQRTHQISPELRCLQRVIDKDIMRADERLRCRRRRTVGGTQPGGGTRTITAPTIINREVSQDHKGSATPIWVGVDSWLISQTDNGEGTAAPPPNPMIAIPVAIPGRSGNHLINVDTGESSQCRCQSLRERRSRCRSAKGCGNRRRSPT